MAAEEPKRIMSVLKGLETYVDCPKCGEPMAVNGVVDLGHAYLTVRCSPCGYAARYMREPTSTGREGSDADR
jgi:transcription elongation factor Elf1